MYKTKNTLADNTRKTSISLLQTALSNAIDLGLQCKQAHWNVKGPSFIALHELFDQLNKEVAGYADQMAERIVSLGGQAYGTISAVKDTSSLDEYPKEAVKQSEHIQALSKALAVFGGQVRMASDEAGETGDQNTSDLFTEISRAIDKSLWFVEAHAAP